MNLNREERNEDYILKSRAQFLTTGEYYGWRCGHNEFEVVTSGRNPVLFMIATGKEGCSLWAFLRSHGFLHFPSALKNVLASTFYVGLVSILTQAMFVGQGYLQHRGAEWNGSRRFRYHVYFIPSDTQLMDEVALVYGDSLTVQVATGSYWIASKVVENMYWLVRTCKRKTVRLFQGC